MNEEHATLLIVEDNVDLAKLLRKLLLLQGYDVMLADRGEDALTACSYQSPDLILLDIHLEDMDGTEMCHRSRYEEYPCNFPCGEVVEEFGVTWIRSTGRRFHHHSLQSE